MFLETVFGLIASLYLTKLYFRHSLKKCVNNVSLVGKTIVVTGANTGIGFHSAVEFAKRGARVILACRDKDKAETARADIVRQTENNNVVVKLIDMSSFESVRDCAKDIMDHEEKLDILVNNAGAVGLPQKTTSDGFDVLMQINYFGPTLFTLLLLDFIKRSPRSRIINVASILAKVSFFDPLNLNKYSGIFGTYVNSKLCNILFTIKLAEILKDSNVSVFSLHPGAVKTNIFRRATGWAKIVLDLLVYFGFRTAEEGAQTIIYAATEPSIEKFSGKHFAECGVVPPYTSTKKTDPDLAGKVWKETCRLLEIDEKKIILPS